MVVPTPLDQTPSMGASFGAKSVCANRSSGMNLAIQGSGRKSKTTERHGWRREEYSQNVELHLSADERVLLVDEQEPLLHQALLLFLVAWNNQTKQSESKAGSKPW